MLHQLIKPSGGYHLRRAGGFSLLELLVSIAVIAILMTVVFAVADRSRDKAQLIQCTNSIRQWGNGFLLFTTEHDGVLPQQFEVEGEANTSWHEAISTYIVGEAQWGSRFLMRREFGCPGNSMEGVEYNGSHYLDPKKMDTPTRKRAPRTLNDIDHNLSDFLLISENYTGGFWDTSPWHGPGTNSSRIDYTRHAGGVANFLFADFHVEALTYQQTLDRPVITLNR